MEENDLEKFDEAMELQRWPMRNGIRRRYLTATFKRKSSWRPTLCCDWAKVGRVRFRLESSGSSSSWSAVWSLGQSANPNNGVEWYREATAWQPQASSSILRLKPERRRPWVSNYEL